MNTKRYQVVLPWGGINSEGSFFIQEADLLDKQTGRTYIGGAQRVVDARNDMKPVKGRGGTSPFAGECAWSDAERLMRDLAFRERYAR